MTRKVIVTKNSTTWIFQWLLLSGRGFIITFINNDFIILELEREYKISDQEKKKTLFNNANYLVEIIKFVNSATPYSLGFYPRINLKYNNEL